MTDLIPYEGFTSPTRNMEAERALIGRMLKSEKDARAVAVLSEDDFQGVEARKCFRVCKMIMAKNVPIDLVTLDAELSKLYQGQDVKDAITFAMEALRYPSISSMIPEYLRLLRDASNRRKLVEIGERLAQLALDPAEDVDVMIETARANLRNMVRTDGKWVSISDVLLAAYDRLEVRVKGEEVSIPTGVGEVDRATGGLFKGELTIVGARPSVGKTAFGLQLAMTAAHAGKNVCFVSVEMSDEQMGNRLFSHEGGVDGAAIRNAILTDDDWTLVSDAMIRCGSLPVSFLFGTHSVEDLRNNIQKKVDLNECDAVVIDYLQLLTTKRKFEKEHERIGYISRICKQMSLDFRIPVVVLAQVRRQNNQGRARCPALDELRGSGDIEQDADNVIFLHRPDDNADPTVDDRDRPYFNALKGAGYDYIVFNIAKQRQGHVGLKAAAFDAPRMRYMSLDRMREPEDAERGE